MAEYWRCKPGCLSMNPPRTRKCQACGKARRKKRRPQHMAALGIPYEEYVRINGSETCGVCGRPPSPKRRLDRDHDHKTGQPRGLLCPADNRLLSYRVTPKLLRAAAKYLEKSTIPLDENS